MTPYERFALWEYLTDFDDAMEFKEVLRDLRKDGDSVTIWEPYEDFDRAQLSGMIRQTAIEAAMWFAPKDIRSVFKKEEA